MNRTQLISGKITALSAIQHNSDEVASTDSKLRKTKISILSDNNERKTVLTPFITGNSIAGKLRRLAFTHLVSFVSGLVIPENDQSEDFIKTIKKLEISNLAYYTLFTGGMLRKTDADSGKLNIDSKQIFREIIPFISIFGTAYNNQMIESKLKVSDMYPICKEASNITGIPSNQSCFEFLEDRFFTRRDDLDKEEKPEKQDPVQMKYNVEVFVPGTVFHHEFILDMFTPIEKSAFSLLMQLWQELPFVGGRSSRGHGKIKFEYQNLPTESPDLYLNFLSEKKDDILAYIKNM